MTTNPSHPSRASIWRGLIIAAVLLGVAMALKLLSPAYLSPDFARRMMGVLLGAVVVVYANAVPKALSPLIQMRNDPIVEQAMRRFTGWTLVLGGTAYAATWVIAPLENANILAAGFLGAALLVVIAQLAWGMAKGRAHNSKDPAVANPPSAHIQGAEPNFARRHPVTRERT